MLRAIKQYDNFEITRYAGPCTCLYAILFQDHCGLDSNFIISEIQDLVKEVPTIFITGIGAVLKNKFKYMASYRKL